MSDTYGLSYVLIFLTGLLAIAMFRWPDRKTGNIRFFSPLRWFALGFSILFVIQPFNHLYYGEWVFEVFDNESFDWMQLACFLSGLSFLLGWALRPYLSSANSRMRLNGRVDSRIGYWPQFWVLIVPSAVGIGLILSWYGGGIDSFLAAGSGNVYDAGAAGTYALTTFAFSATLSLALLGLISVRGKILTRPGLISIVLLVVYAIISVQLGARLRILFLCMGLIGLLGAQMGRKSFISLMVLGAILMMFFVYAHARLRYEFAYTSLGEELAERLDPGEGGFYHSFFMKGDFDAFENGIGLLNAVPLHHDFLYGGSILSLLYNPIPRIWWPEKPTVSSGEILQSTQFGRRPADNFNVATCLPAELYINFWWPGIIFGMMLFGYISRVFYDRSAIDPDSSKSFVHLGLFCAYILLVLRGSFHSMTANYLYVVSWMILSSIASRFISRRQHGQHQLRPT